MQSGDGVSSDRRSSPHAVRYGEPEQRGFNMRGWFSQIVIGIIVTVIGTVVANALVGNGRGGRHHVLPGVHVSGPARH